MVTWLGYTRVSRVGDRAETLISPDLQADRIRAYARRRGIEVQMLEAELDVSGGRVERPVLSEAIGRVERGDTEGIVVAQLDRLSRMDIADALKTIERIESGGGQVIAVAENFDAGTPEGRFARNMFLSMSQMQLDRYKAQFAAAKAQAVRRGIWPIPKPPRGYVVGPERQLVADPEVAPKVVRAFEARAAGKSWGVVADILDSGTSGAGKTIRNRAYLGEINLGHLRNPAAHEPLVSRALWEAAQIEHPRPPRNRQRRPALLTGIVRCANCGYAMSPDSYRSGWMGYRCRPRHASSRCEAPAMITARLLDPFVEAIVLHHAGALEFLAEPEDLSSLEVDLERAEAELDAYQQLQRVTDLGASAFAAGMQSRVEAVEAAREELAKARRPAGPDLEIGSLVALWPTLDLDDRRHLLRGALSAVEVTRGRGHVAQRVRILDPEGAPVAVPEELLEGGAGT